MKDIQLNKTQVSLSLLRLEVWRRFNYKNNQSIILICSIAQPMYVLWELGGIKISIKGLNGFTLGKWNNLWLLSLGISRIIEDGVE